MMRLRIDVDNETFDRLARNSEAERRDVPSQAAVILRRALGLPFPPKGAEPEDAKGGQHALNGAAN